MLTNYLSTTISSRLKSQNSINNSVPESFQVQNQNDILDFDMRLNRARSSSLHKHINRIGTENKIHDFDYFHQLLNIVSCQILYM